MDIPSTGVICNIPEISTTDRELNLLCTQSTKKNINVDKEPCIKTKRIPFMVIEVSPQFKVK